MKTIVTEILFDEIDIFDVNPKNEIMKDSNVLDEDVIISPPIKIVESERYKLVIQDSNGRTHYFNFDGSYDGWSDEVNFCRRMTDKG